MADTILFRLEGGLAWITLNRPEARNAINDEMRRALMKQNSQRLIRTVLELEKPIVAAVNGVAAGMGAHLALACDLVIMAAEARRIGLCNRVVARAGLEAAAREWGERLARGPTLALGMSKRLLQRAYESGLETCLEEEALAQTLVAQSEDTQEGVRAFAERRR